MSETKLHDTREQYMPLPSSSSPEYLKAYNDGYCDGYSVGYMKAADEMKALMLSTDPYGRILIKDLYLPYKLRALLYRSCIVTVKDVLDRSPDQIFNIKGIGEKLYFQLFSELETIGINVDEYLKRSKIAKR